MSTWLNQSQLEQTIINQAYEITCLSKDINYTIDNLYEVKEQHQKEKDRADRYSELIYAISQFVNDKEWLYEEEVASIQTLVNHWHEWSREKQDVMIELLLNQRDVPHE